MIKKLFILTMVISVIGLSSCNKDEETVSLEESKANVENLQVSMEDDMSLAMDTEGLNALMMFSELMSIDDPMDEGQVNKKSTSETIELKDLILKRLLGTASYMPEPIDISEYYGTYTWNATNEGWVIVQNDPDNKVVFIFPSESPESTVNDVTINIYEYEEVLYEYEYDGYQEWAIVPTTVHADLLKDGVKYVEIEADVEYNDYAEPTSIDGSIYLKPFTLEAGLSVANNKTSVNFSLSQGGTKIVSTGLSVTFIDELYEDVNIVEGYIQYRDIKLAGDIDVATMDSYEQMPTEDQFNENINLALYNYPQGSKFADIEFEYDEVEEYMKAYIVYTDGTKLDAQEILMEIMAMLEDVIPSAPKK